MAAPPSTGREAGRVEPVPSKPKRAVRRVTNLLAARPVLSTFVVALAARLAVVAGIIVATDGAIVPDERQYIDFATLASRNELTNTVWYGGAIKLYHTTGAFFLPLDGIFRVLWPWRGFAMVFVALLGAVTAALAARLAREVVPAGWALLAGLLVALVPSQILWSSLVLRESEVWSCVAVLALAAAFGPANPSRLRQAAWWALAAAAGVALAYLRVQTMLVALWALPLAVLLVGRPTAWRDRARWAVATALIALVVPWAAGRGVGGIDLVRQSAGRLDATRTYLSMDANSAFVPTTLVPEPEGPSVTRPPAAIVDGAGQVYAVDESARTSIRALPRGLVATLLRPFPWESATSAGLRAAQVEAVLWWGLYVLAGIGWWAQRRRWKVLAYPFVVTLGIAAVAAVTQGNLGTAFRHRGQLLWALAVPAVAGLQHLVDRRRRRTAADEEPEAAPVRLPARV